MLAEPEQALAAAQTAAKAGACVAHAKRDRSQAGPRTPGLHDLRAVVGLTDPAASRSHWALIGCGPQHPPVGGDDLGGEQVVDAQPKLAGTVMPAGQVTVWPSRSMAKRSLGK